MSVTGFNARRREAAAEAAVSRHQVATPIAAPAEPEPVTEPPADQDAVETASGVAVRVIEKGPAWRRIEALDGSVMVRAIRPSDVDAWLAEH